MVSECDPESSNDIQRDGDGNRLPRKERRDENAQRPEMDHCEAGTNGVITPRSTVDGSGFYHQTPLIPISGGVGCRLRGLRRRPARGFELFFRDGQERLERLLVANGEFGERFAIERHATLFQTVDEPRVTEPLAPRCGVDPRDPERPEVALADAPVAIGIVQRMEQRLVGDAVVATPRGAEALHELHHFTAVFDLVESAFDPCHVRALLYQVGDLRGEAPEVAGADRLVFSEFALALARLLAQDVSAAAELMAVRHLPVGADFDAFRGSAMRPDLRHWWRLLGALQPFRDAASR